MKIRLTCLFVVIMLLLAGCANAGAGPSLTQATPIPTSTKGTGTVTGKLLNKDGKAPVTEQLVRLATIYGQGTDAIYVYNESSDPGNYTDGSGFFVINNVPPGPYAVILIDKKGNYSPIIASAEKILTLDATADQVTAMGDILVDLTSMQGQ